MSAYLDSLNREIQCACEERDWFRRHGLPNCAKIAEAQVRNLCKTRLAFLERMTREERGPRSGETGPAAG